MGKGLTAEHYQGIGEVVVVWARLETHIVKVLRALTRMTMKEALVIYWQMGYRERLTVLRGLIITRHPSKDDTLRQNYKILEERIASAYTKRNLVAHSIWFPGINTGEISPFDFSAKGGTLKIEGRGIKRPSFTAQTFSQQAVEIDCLAEDFKYFFSTNFNVRFIHKKLDNLN